jgi:hypothetical protein
MPDTSSKINVLTTIEEIIDCYGQPMDDEQLKLAAIALEYRERLENSLYVIRVEE